ncbi:hypothetical protein [Deinococcus roseus]|uniref:Uncharacterized protein n=1 Tax=Deinococcus roseus TaxID=392414 RepID=A0ABQ2CUR5_9DEIO|nr:hypothetical protein [Deinococcus roseus]GGJ22701.1 hypothetical protein GCM10008938_06140 [Deinococcus roseus]
MNHNHMVMLALLFTPVALAQNQKSSAAEVFKTTFSRPHIQKNNLLIEVTIKNMFFRGVSVHYGGCAFAYQAMNEKGKIILQDPYSAQKNQKANASSALHACPATLYTESLQPGEQFKGATGVSLPLKLFPKGTYTLLTQLEAQVWIGSQPRRMWIKGTYTFKR